MATLTSGPNTADFILEEVSPAMSRGVITVTTDLFEAGTVVSRETSADPYGECDVTHTDVAVVYAKTDATVADVDTLAVVRLAVLKEANLTWPATFTTGNIATMTAALAAQYLISRG